MRPVIGTSGVTLLPDRFEAKQGFAALQRTFPGATADPVEIVVAKGATQPTAQRALTALRTKLAGDASFGRGQIERSPDGRVLYLAVTRGNCVWRVPLLPDGSVSKVNQFFTSYGPSGPDGLAVDAQGRVLVANPGLGYLWVLNTRAEPVQVLRGPAGASITNLAFGGAERRTLFVTDSTHGCVMTAEMDIPGLPLARR